MKFKSACAVAAVLAALGAAVPAAAQSIASKMEYMGTARHIDVTALMARERNGFLAVQFEVANSSSSARRLFYRVKWLDESGFQVWDDEAWKPVLVQALSRQNIQMTAPTPKARDFRIQINGEESWSVPVTQPNEGFIN